MSTAAAVSASPSTTTERVLGYDVARALAMLGMMVVHFGQVIAVDQKHPAWAAGVLRLLDGRPAATFIVLAGVGLSLLTRRARAGIDPRVVSEARKVLVRRGVFLLTVGFINLVVWPGDILRVYGVSLFVAAALVTASDRRLLGVALGFVLGFIALLFVVDYDKHWDWSVMKYHDLWSPGGVIRNLLYDGFRSVFPWTGLLVFGMWLGRRDLCDRSLNTRFFLVAAAVALGAEALSWLGVGHFLKHPHGMNPDEVKALFGTESMPPLPLFLLSAGGTAVAVIALCVRLASARPSAVWVRPLAATGQLALTWYFGHIVIGLGSIVALGLATSRPLPVGELCGALFFAATVVASTYWKRRFRHGPLEWVMRTVCG